MIGSRTQTWQMPELTDNLRSVDAELYDGLLPCFAPIIKLPFEAKGILQMQLMLLLI